MDLQAALEIVVKDIRASYPVLSTPMAVHHALNTTWMDALNMDDPTGPAYKAMLEANTAQQVLALAKTMKVALVAGDVREIDGVATIDGINPFVWLDAIFC
jgi:subtilase family serine protease